MRRDLTRPLPQWNMPKSPINDMSPWLYDGVSLLVGPHLPSPACCLKRCNASVNQGL